MFSAPCWLSLLALHTCSGLGCKYSSLGTCHHFWAGSLSCLSHCWGVFGCAVQSGTAPCGKVTSSYSLSDRVSSLQRAHVGRQTESPITCPTLLFGVATMQEGAGRLRNLHKHLSLQEHACYYIPCWVIAYLLPQPQESCWWGEWLVRDPTSSQFVRYIILMRRPRRSNLCWDYSLSGAKMDWGKCVGVMSHILTLQGTSRIGWTLKTILLLRTCHHILASVFCTEKDGTHKIWNWALLVRKSIKSDGQGTMLFGFAARKRSHFSAWQKDADWYCWCFGVLQLQLSHSREHQHWPESLSICLSLVFRGGSTCSITLCVCVCVCSPVCVSALSCPSPSPVTFEPVDQFQRNLTDNKKSPRY